MELKNQVVSLELSKRLKELGVKQESLWWWELSGDMDNPKWNLIITSDSPNWAYKDPVSAFTVAELGEMLPFDICLNKHRKLNGGWGCGFATDDPKIKTKAPIQVADTEANACAKMLIYLKEREK